MNCSKCKKNPSHPYPSKLCHSCEKERWEKFKNELDNTMKWLNVKKYKPPEWKVVFVYTKGNFFNVGRFSENEWLLLDNSNNEVTHFCIPDPIPVEEEE